MTYQNLTEKHDDNADEASPLLLTKKKHGVSMRAMIATTCFFLGSLAVIYYGRGSSSSSSSSNNTNRHDGTSAALLLDHNQAATQVYDPSQDDCYADADNAGKYCYFPCREYNIVNNHYVLNNKCPVTVCEYAVPCGNWNRVTDAEDDNCGIPCTINCGVQNCVLPTLYDPRRDFCFRGLGKGYKNKYCWYPTDNTPVGNWEGVTGAAYNGCGAKCDKVQHYDPSGSYPNGCDCFQDTDNPGKYCWLYDTGYRPYGNWKRDGKHAYDDCGPMCTDY